MDYVFKPAAKEALEELDNKNSEKIMKAIEEVSEQGFSHENIKLIKDQEGNWLYRLKVQDEKINQRVFLEYIDKKLKIFDILDRECAYEEEYGNG